MFTTITVNGPNGSRFLSFIAGRLPPRLALLVHGSIRVDTDLAEELARLVERSIEEGFTADEPPLLFSPNVGDTIAIVRDVLVEVQGASRRAPRTWRYVARGSRGRVVAHQGTTDRVLLEPSGEVAYVRPLSMTGTRFMRHG